MPHDHQRFEIELANGRRLRVGHGCHGFDLASLRALVSALEAT
jgi:hypothetical protein